MSNTEDNKTESPLQTLKVSAQLLGFPYKDRLDDPEPPRDLKRGQFDRIAGSWGRMYHTVPIGEDNSHVIVATAQPFNSIALDQLSLCYDKPLKLVITSEEEILRAINSIRTNLMSDRSSDLNSEEKEQDDPMDTQLKIDVTDSEDDDAPIIRYVNAIIFKASTERASDVHIEPYESSLNVRFRIDGVLYDIAKEDKTFQASIISRIKIMAKLNIAEKRLPQDGRIGLKLLVTMLIFVFQRFLHNLVKEL